LLTAGVLLITLVYALLLWRPGKSADPAQAAYLRFCRKLARAGLKRAPHEGAHAFADRVARRRVDLAEPIVEITNLYEDLRYGRATTDHKKFASLKKRVAAFRT
jgi:hypothetical protein